MFEASSIPIDDGAIGTLERYIAHDNLEDIIASIERDMPPTFFDETHVDDSFSSLSVEPICLPDEHNTSWRFNEMQQVKLGCFSNHFCSESMKVTETRSPFDRPQRRLHRRDYYP